MPSPFRRCLPLCALAVAAAARGQEPTPRDQVRALERHVRRLVEDVELAVVAVSVSHLNYPGPPPDRTTGRLGGYSPPARDPLAPPTADRLDLADPDAAADHRFGSGLVLDADRGLVLTAFHLIDGATKVYVRGPGGGGSYADIHAADARSDLAVVRLLAPLPNLRPVRFADVRLVDGPAGTATLSRGSFVVAVGHPLAAGFADGTPTAGWGVVGGLRRRAAGPGRDHPEGMRVRGLHHYGSLIQTDARLAVGSSGGGLFDLDGRLVGVTAPLAALTGADTAGGFAVPMDVNYRRIVDALRQGREVEYGFLGVSIGRDVRNGRGLAVEGVAPGSPAARAGLTPADTILAVDGHPIRTADDLFLYVGAALAGSDVRLTVRQGDDGPERYATATLVKFPHGMPWLASRRPDPAFGLHVDYSSVLAVELQLVRDPVVAQLGLPPGVVVRAADAGSPAAAKLAPLADGDRLKRLLITHVDDRPVAAPDDFRRAAAGKDAVRLRLIDTDSNRGHVVELP